MKLNFDCVNIKFAFEQHCFTQNNNNPSHA